MAFNILLLNLIIAILANTYNIFDARSNGLYLSKILVSRDEMVYDESYGSFLAAIPPTNVVQLPFIPAALSFRYNSPVLVKLNKMVMQLQYVIFMSIFFCLFVIVSAALTPLAFIVGCFDKLKSMNSQESGHEKLLNNLLFFPLGLGILVGDMVSDIFYFWKNNFRPHDQLKQIIIAKEKSTVDHSSLREIMNLCRLYEMNKIKSVFTHQFIKSFSKKLNVNQNLQFLLFGQLIPVGGFQPDGTGGPGKKYTFKSMKT